MPKVRRSMFDDNDREQMPDTPKKDMEQKPITTKTTSDSDFSEATGDTSGTGANSSEQTTTPTTEGSGTNNPPPPPPVNDGPLTPDDTGSEYNPLDGKVVQKDYRKGPDIGNVRVEERVEEPTYEPAPPPPPKKDPNAPQPGPKTPPTNPNPSVSVLEPKDIRLSATMLVDGILGGYKWAWQGASNYAKISDEQIIDWKLNDKLDLDLRIQLATGDEITMLEFYATYNANAASAFEVSDAFIESVREPMIREFSKRQWGITDMQFIMQAFGRDAVSKLGALWQLKRTLNHINNAVFKQYEDIKKQKADILEREEKLRKAEAAARTQPQQPRQERPTQQPQQQQRRTSPRQQPQQPTPEPEVEVTPPTQQRPTATSGGGGLVQSFEIPENDGSDITEIPYVDTNSDKTEE